MDYKIRIFNNSIFQKFISRHLYSEKTKLQYQKYSKAFDRNRKQKSGILVNYMYFNLIKSNCTIKKNLVSNLYVNPILLSFLEIPDHAILNINEKVNSFDIIYAKLIGNSVFSNKDVPSCIHFYSCRNIQYPIDKVVSDFNNYKTHFKILLTEDFTLNTISILRCALLNHSISHKESIRIELMNIMIDSYNSVDSESRNTLLNNIIYNYKYFYALGLNLIEFFIKINSYDYLKSIIFNCEKFNENNLFKFSMLNLLNNKRIKKRYPKIYNEIINKLKEYAYNQKVQKIQPKNGNVYYKFDLHSGRYYEKEGYLRSNDKKLVVGNDDETIILNTLSFINIISNFLNEYVLEPNRLMSSEEIIKIIRTVTEIVYIEVSKKKVLESDIFMMLLFCTITGATDIIFKILKNINNYIKIHKYNAFNNIPDVQMYDRFSSIIESARKDDKFGNLIEKICIQAELENVNLGGA